MDAPAQRDHVGSRDDLVGEFRLARLPEQDARRACVVDAELAPRGRCAAYVLPVSSSTSGCTRRSMRAMSSARSACALRSCTQPSMDGWITMPQANGLYVLKEISKRSPSSSVISFHAHLVE